MVLILTEKSGATDNLATKRQSCRTRHVSEQPCANHPETSQASVPRYLGVFL